MSGAVSLVSIGQELQKQLNSGAISQQDAEALMVGHAEKTLAALWKVNVLDIEKTLEAVCVAVLNDAGAAGLAGRGAGCRKYTCGGLKGSLSRKGPMDLAWRPWRCHGNTLPTAHVMACTLLLLSPLPQSRPPAILTLHC